MPSLHHLIVFDVRLKLCCNYNINYWVMAVNVFCKVTGSLDVWPPKSNQFIRETKSDEIPSRHSCTTQKHYSVMVIAGMEAWRWSIGYLKMKIRIKCDDRCAIWLSWRLQGCRTSKWGWRHWGHFKTSPAIACFWRSKWHLVLRRQTIFRLFCANHNRYFNPNYDTFQMSFFAATYLAAFLLH